MAVRIHFTDDDLVGIRLAQTPDPMWEALLSMHMLQTDTGSAVFGGWRRRVRHELPPAVRPLLRLAPPVGYSADFLTPATASHHVGILRRAGLVSTCKAGKAVLHTATPLGVALLGGESPAWGT